MGDLVAVATDITPPSERIINRCPVNPRPESSFDSFWRYVATRGLMYASSTVVEVLSYSLYSLTTSEERETDFSGYSDLTISPTLVSWVGFL